MKIVLASMALLCATGLRAEEAPKPSTMTERELYLLNEIELLKNRLAELESHVVGGSGKSAAPVGIATPPLEPAVAAAPLSAPSSSTAATAAPQNV